MKKLILFYIILMSSIAVNAQMTLEQIKADKNYGWFQHFEAIARYGGIMAHHEEMVDMTSHPFQALELRIGWQSYGTEDFHQKLNYPTYGIGVYSSRFHTKEIGNPSAIFGFIDFPVWRRDNKDKLDVSLGVGLSYEFNPYDQSENPGNIAIGSLVNVYFDLGVKYNINLGERWSIRPGINLSHFSNSSTTQPNLGLNMIDINVGALYRFNPIKRFTKDRFPEYEPAINPTFIESVPDPIWKKNHWHIRGATGVRQNKNTNDSYYGIGLATIGYTHQVNYIYKIGGGVDLMFDSSIPTNFWEYKGETAPKNAAYTAGVNVSNALIVGRLELELQVGLYLWKQYRDDLYAYLRPGFKFFITEQLYTHVSFKTEYIGQAQYIEWGLGVYIF
ncbi:MAG: acyloxyacyl hydrolase [Bacteroidota bacterium]